MITVCFLYWRRLSPLPIALTDKPAPPPTGSATERSLFSLLKILFLQDTLKPNVHLNGDEIFSFDEFDEDMIQERSEINGERKCSNLIILSFANHESGSRSVLSVFFVIKLSAFFLTGRPF